MNKLSFAKKFNNKLQSSYQSGWNLALQNYHVALKEFKSINPKPKSELKILKFKSR